MVHLLLAIIYLAFISLGLPDAILGAAWPTIYPAFSVPISYAGLVSVIICLGTVISSLQCDRLTRWLGTGKVTAFSVATTAIALFGFSVTRSFWGLCLWAIPYGLGAGSVDASLNNYVALHYESRHMSWLHCFWGIGATLGPYIMGYALTSGSGWHWGYRYIAILQVVLTAILLLSLPKWKPRPSAAEGASAKPLSLRQILAIPGTKQILLFFFVYSALELTVSLWASSYLSIYKGVSAEIAASFAGMFFLGLTVGRAIAGFVTMKLNDTQMIRLGSGMMVVGVLLLILPGGATLSLVGFALFGFGCAPVYPCILHSTPTYFGTDKSQALIGVQTACAYFGNCVIPPLFGVIANHISVSLLPVFLLIFLAVMIGMYEWLLKKVK